MTAWGWGLERGWRVTANRYDVSFWSDENWVELNNGDGCKTMNIKKKASELQNFKGWILWCGKELDMTEWLKWTETLSQFLKRLLRMWFEIVLNL